MYALRVYVSKTHVLLMISNVANKIVCVCVCVVCVCVCVGGGGWC